MLSTRKIMIIGLTCLVAGPAVAESLSEDVRTVGYTYGLYRACTSYYAERGGLDALWFRVPLEDRNLAALRQADPAPAGRDDLIATYESAKKLGSDVGTNRIRILNLSAEIRDTDDQVKAWCETAKARVEPCLEDDALSAMAHFSRCADAMPDPEKG
ncbi:hypothetical protein [Minwuia sp.]|uniref:hypothetical protein n=1 Tax=Minwuia sp. TaxID=2493630 RepID=UPI003A9013BB